MPLDISKVVRIRKVDLDVLRAAHLIGFFDLPSNTTLRMWWCVGQQLLLWKQLLDGH
jgi:hypothetical protein